MTGCAFKAHVQGRVVWKQLFLDHSACRHAQPGSFPWSVWAAPASLCVGSVSSLVASWSPDSTGGALLCDRVTDTNPWFLFLFIVNKDPKGSKIFSLFGPSAFLSFLCMFPLLALFSVVPSAPSSSLGEPGSSTGASWALLFLKNFLLPPVLLLYFAIPNFFFL